MGKVSGLAVSVVGSSHINRNKECQDRSRFFAGRKANVVIVCDGHGGEKHFRSSRGAEFAVETIISVADIFANTVTKKITESFRLKKLKDLEKNIIFEWRNKVAADIARDPFHEDEILKLSLSDQKAISENCYLAYGTTMLCVLQIQDYNYIIQLGDGNIVEISNGQIILPLENDPRIHFNYTTSLCAEDAFGSMRDAIVHRQEQQAFFLSSDGVFNSFTDETAFYDFVNMIYENRNCMEIESEIKDFLPQLTKEGSGDDVSIGLLFNE